MVKPLIIGILSFLLIPVVLSGCKKKETESLRGDAVKLYNESVAVLKAYTDSFASAPDSATLLSLHERFNKKLTTVNFNYPSETCLEISEGENDTLTNLTERIVLIKDSMLYRYAHPIVKDSLLLEEQTIDSISKTPSLK